MTLNIADLEATDLEREYVASTMRRNGHFHSPKHFIDDPEFAVAHSTAVRLKGHGFNLVKVGNDSYEELTLTPNMLAPIELSSLSVLAVGAISLSSAYPSLDKTNQFLLSMRRYRTGDGMEWHIDDEGRLLGIDMIHLSGKRNTTFRTTQGNGEITLFARPGDLLKVPTCTDTPEAISHHMVAGPAENEETAYTLQVIRFAEDSIPEELTFSLDNLIENALRSPAN